MSMLQKYVPNSFPLPHEVFELGLSPGPLLVYISLVYHKSLRHGTGALSCAAISKLIGLCEKTVRTHLRALEDEGLIQVENIGGKSICTLCPIRDIVEKRRAAVSNRTQKICWRSTIAIQEISKEYQRQKTNLCSPMDESARKPQQYLAEVGIMT